MNKKQKIIVGIAATIVAIYAFVEIRRRMQLNAVETAKERELNANNNPSGIPSTATPPFI